MWNIPWYANHHINKIAAARIMASTTQSYYAAEKNDLQQAEDRVCLAWKKTHHDDYRTMMKKNSKWVGV